MKFKNHLLVALLTVLLSCNSGTKDNEEQTKENKQESSEEKWEDNNFPVVEFKEVVFSENVKNKKGDGASLFVDFTILNDTANRITSFTLRYYAKAVFEDDSFEYYPHSAFVYATHDDYKRFDDITYGLSESIPKDDVWLPDSTRNFTFVVFDYYGLGWMEYNLSEKTFERTPDQFVLAYRYKAISVDAEYEKVKAYNLLPQWKEYQEKIGLR
ncbi:MAG: hypothetical protein U5L09_01815 [Bacteroidales bacterium]|nr:hypothetical protein [Bacteroidales bacterium]